MGSTAAHRRRTQEKPPMSPAPPPAPRRARLPWLLAATAALGGGALALWWFLPRAPATAPAAAVEAKGGATPRPTLSVTLTQPRREDWSRTLAAQGNIVAWQEAAVGTELSGYRVTEVLVNVGDRVKKGQTLAVVNAETVASDVAQARAAVAEAEAVLAEARTNAARSRDLAAKGFVSPQAATQTATGEETATARLAAARAKLQAEETRLARTRVLAPDDGTIAARNATVGSLTQPAQDLFRLIRGNRLEWRAEVTAGELGRIAPGMTATLQLPGGGEVKGRVRMIAPTVDPQTRVAIVYVDLPTTESGTARAGMFARGEIELGRTSALSLPQSAVVQRDGFSYVFLVGPGDRVAQAKVVTGRRIGERIEVTDGLAPDAEVVAAGAGFLADGDTVRVVPATPAPAR
jgi:HlyD family secretion protein